MYRPLLAAITLAIAAGLATVRGPSEPTTSSDGQLRVIAIGDSFVAGNGTTNYYPGQGPGQPDSGGPRVPGPGRNCFQSYSSYPWQYVQRLNDNAHPAAIWHAACSGAWTWDLGAQWSTVPADWRSGADIVLISAGGNDVGFSTIVLRCLMGVPGTPQCDSTLEAAEDAMAGALERLHAATLAIAAEAPDAQIALVGYPLLASPVDQRCPSRGEQRLTELQARHDTGLVVLARDLNVDLGGPRVTPVLVSGRFANRGPCSWSGPLLHDWAADDGERFHPNWQGANVYAEVLFDHELHDLG